MEKQAFLQLTTQIVSSYVRHNPLPMDQLPALIQQVHGTFHGLGEPAGRAKKLAPAVPVKKSVQPDAIICLDCGRSAKMLKRHLATAHGLTPEAFRQRWGLAADYPMVAPNYAKQRSKMARKIGLGTRRQRKAGGTQAG